MKFRNIYQILLVLMLFFPALLGAQNYDRLWQRVEEMQRKDLPRSVIAEARRIYGKAEAERNVPQMMKAYLTMMSFRESLSPDSVAVDMQGLEAWADAPSTEGADRAVLYSILGELGIRKDFAKADRWLRLSLKDSVMLASVSASRWVPMVETGETSRLYMGDNLYDLLARRAVRLWEQNRWRTEQEEIDRTIRDVRGSLLRLYEREGKREAWLLTALEAEPDAGEARLREWIKEYGDLDVCAEVYLRLAQWMLREDCPAERLALLREGIARYPRYVRINALKNEEREILSPRLSLSVADVYPGRPMTMDVHYRNLAGVSVALYRLDLHAESPLLAKVDAKNVTKYGTLVRKEHVGLPSTSDYRERMEKVALEMPESGIYYLVATPAGYDALRRGALVHATGLQLIYRALPGDRQELVVLDRRSGHPVPHAQVEAFDEQAGGYVRKEAYDADASGVVTLTGHSGRRGYFRARTDADKAMPVSFIWFGNARYEVSHRPAEHVRLFTDRALYRPGQEVCFGGVAYVQTNDSIRADASASYTVCLLDAEGRKVAEQAETTDEMGAFGGKFKLPSSGRSGIYALEAGKNRVTFRVEEYKRPTFEVTFDSVATVYRPGDTIRVSGEARTFAGVPVQGATIAYKVSRHVNAFWRMRGVETHRLTGQAVTDAEGRFEVPVHFLPIEEGHVGGYIYKVSADVTSLSGETRTGNLDLPLAISSVQVRIPDWEGATMLREAPRPLTFSVANLKGVPVPMEVGWQVFRTKEGLEGEMLPDEKVLDGKSMSNKPFMPEAIYTLPSGRYCLKAVVEDEAGNRSQAEATFVLFSPTDNRLPYKADVWSWQSGEEFGADGTATLCLGSREEDVYLLVDEFWGENRMESRRMQFSDSLLTFRYTYREEYGDGLRVNLAFVKNGRLFSRTVFFKKPKDDKRLVLKWKTFRDKLRPGASETWTLSVLHPDGKPADARLMATLFDASLDALAPHNWTFTLEFPRSLPGASWGSLSSRGAYWGFSFPMKNLKCNPLEYSRLSMPRRAMEEGIRMYKAMGAGAVMSAKNTAALEEESVSMDAAVAQAEMVDGSSARDTDLLLRRDFSETAFFCPQLRTDAAGNVNLEFTLPESLTEWRFIGLAHTKDMDHGLITARATASKEFMLQPHWPRFVRVGDKVTLAASLMNFSSKKVEGIIRMELLDAKTEKTIAVRKRRFAVGANETGAVTFEFEVDDRCETLVCRIVADGETFSDGEQRYLPVLSNKQRLTESVLLDVDGAGTEVFSLKELFNRHSSTATHPRMVVEFTGNPVWLAVQALPVLACPQTDDALSWAASLYADRLTDYLAKSHSGLADSLNVDGLDVRIREAVVRLKELQQADGSWSWFQGMAGNRYVTEQIVEMMARLQAMTGSLPEDEDFMYRQAFGFLKKETAEQAQRMKEAGSEGDGSWLPFEQALRYLYICALDGRLPMDKDVNSYLLAKLAESTNRLTIYGKALASVVLHRSGKTDKARECLRSLMEYSVTTDGMGRFFDSPKAEYSWFSYRIPTQVAAIEAVHLLIKDAETVEQMKRWLLKQKQVQDWQTPIATVDAVYALLKTGKDWLSNSAKARIILGRELVETPDDHATGYVKREIAGDVKKIKTVTVEKPSDGMAWGAVYAEFLEDMDKVAASGDALRVSRTIYKNGKKLADGEVVGVGDRLLVRLAVTADRDMDFVRVTDGRAACVEPVETLSGYRWRESLGYYMETKDASTEFYIDRLRKGTHYLEYEVFVTLSGEYLQGIPTVKSEYAPEFTGHGSSGRLLAK